MSASGLQWNDHRERDPAWVRRVQGELFALYAAGKLRPEIMRAFPMAFADARSAWSRAARRAARWS